MSRIDSIWRVLGPGGGGATFFPTFHPTDPSRIAIRCDMTGIYLSKDGGESWTLHNLTSTASAFAFEAGNKDVVYAGSTGLFRTEDFGKSWQRLFPSPEETLGHSYFGDHAGISFDLAPNSVYPSPSGSVSAILIHPDDPAALYIGVSSREGANVCVSTDRGTSWRQTADLDGRITGLFSAPANPESVFAVTRTSVYQLTTDGDVSDRRALPDEASPATRTSAGWDAENDDLRIYVVAGSEDGAMANRPGRGFVSEDAGQSWRRFDDQVAAEASIAPEEVELSFYCISTSPVNSRTAYAVCDQFKDKNAEGIVGTWYGILKTADGGESWEWVFKEGGGAGGYNVRDGVVADNVDDGWSTEAFGGSYLRVIDVGVFPADPEIASYTDWYRSMKTVDGGGHWAAMYSRTLPDGASESKGLDVTTTYGVHFDPFDPNHYAISYTDIAYWHTFDNGASWKRSDTGIPTTWINTCYWVQFDPEMKDKLWSAWGSYHDLPKLKMTRNQGWKERTVGGMATSTDGGRTWKVTSEGLPESNVTCVLLDPSSPVGNRTLYAAVYGKGVYKSTDDGKSWQQKNNGITQEGPNAWELIFGADGVLYVVVAFDVIYDDGTGHRALADGALYRSTDGAETWEQVELPEGVRFPNSLAPDPEDRNRLFLSLWGDISGGEFGGTPAEGKEIETSEGGLLLSEDGGKNWTQVFDPKAYVYGAAVDHRKPGRLYLVTFHHTAHFSEDYGKTWNVMKGYDFHWGHRPVIDPHDPDKIYITTFGSSVWHGKPAAL